MDTCCTDLAKSVTMRREGWGERRKTTEAQRHLEMNARLCLGVAQL